MEDGNLQVSALRSNLRGRAGTFYEALECMVRPVGVEDPRVGLTIRQGARGANLADSRAALSRCSEITADVLVFVNRPLEKVNHLFFEKLIEQATRSDCGLVTGITVDLSGKIVHSGLTRAADGSNVDEFANLMFSDFTERTEAHNVRSVETISDGFFAIRREHLAAVGGLSAVSSSRMPRLVKRLIKNALNQGVHVLVTPCAVATIETDLGWSQKRREGDSALMSTIQNSDEANLVEFWSMSKAVAPESAQTNTHYAVWKSIIPLPPDEMMGNVGAPSIENFLVVADAWGQVIARYISEKATVMDIGCGCGRIARVLVNNPWITKYIGFDVMHEQVRWCQTFIQPKWLPVVEFHWFDLHSETYNPNGAVKTESLTFPAGDETVQVIFAASVFTHLLEADAYHYLQEIRRVLAPRGVALLSIHENVAPGQSFSGTEARIDVDPAYFVQLAGEAGLCEFECIEDFCGQRLLFLKRAQ